MRAGDADVFQDTTHLTEGQHFPEGLDKALQRSDVFLALVSPAWLRSEWCRREFTTFTVDATDAARLHRILPVLWVDTPELSPKSLDVVAKVLANINYSDWRELRYENWDAAANQRQVGKLADSIVSLVRSPVVGPSATTSGVAPNYRFKYGIRWTKDGTPICNKCGLPLTRVEFAFHLHKQVKTLKCSCSPLPIVLMERGEPVDAPDAMRRMSEE